MSPTASRSCTWAASSRSPRRTKFIVCRGILILAPCSRRFLAPSRIVAVNASCCKAMFPRPSTRRQVAPCILVAHMPPSAAGPKRPCCARSRTAPAISWRVTTICPIRSTPEPHVSGAGHSGTPACGRGSLSRVRRTWIRRTPPYGRLLHLDLPRSGLVRWIRKGPANQVHSLNSTQKQLSPNKK